MSILNRRRTLVVLGLLWAVLLTAMPGHTVHELYLGSDFCDQSPTRKGIAVTADGPASQIGVHADVFEPAYGKACTSGSGMVTYLGSGERAGIEAILARDGSRRFATSGVPLTSVEMLQAFASFRSPGIKVHQIPLYVEVQAIGYSLNSCSAPQLNLRSQVLSMIYSGQITFWNDGRIVLDNPALASCNHPIRIIKRADFAGSTATFKDYLSKRNPNWMYYKQPAQNRAWPSIADPCPADGENGMADCIISTPNSIGYIQYHTARVRGIKTARVDNVASALSPDPAARFVAPSPAGCTAAAATAVVPPPVSQQSIFGLTVNGLSPTAGDWSTVSLTDAPQGYPICSLGYALIYEQLQSAYADQGYPVGAARTSVDYLWTAVSSTTQDQLPAHDYASLPPRVAEISRAGLEQIRYFG